MEAMRHLRHGFLALAAGLSAAVFAATQGGPVPAPLPVFPPDNWWNQDISAAPRDPRSDALIAFIGTTRALHPDFGGEVSPGSLEVYGMPFAVVPGSQARKAVTFGYWEESDGVDPTTGRGIPFYPIPDEAISQAHWVEGGPPGNQDVGGDRHLLIIDADNRGLYELWASYHAGSGWTAGSGAFFDLRRNGRRPDTWTSADAAGLAVFPGLVRYDEATGSGEIRHALRVTVRATNGYVYPASHRAGSTAGAPPLGTRLRLKAGKDISGFPPHIQRIFRAMKRHGLIVADNGSDMYVSGTFDVRWNSDELNPAFAALKASDFEVVQLGWTGGAARTPAADFDGDGRADLLWRQESTLHQWRLNGTALAGSGGLPSVSGAWSVQSTADFDGDGRSDILWRETASGSTYLWLMNGAGVVSSGFTSAQAGPEWRLEGAGDFDGDGRADILWRNGGGTAFVWRMNGTGLLSAPVPLGVVGPSWRAAAIADFDADGRDDILWRDYAGGATVMWLATGAGSFGASPTTGVADPLWELRAAGDVDADGRADVVWRHATGLVYIWLMSGANVRPGSAALGTIDPRWQLEEAGDFDGGGKADLLWRDTVTGATYLWFLNGASLQWGGYTGAQTTANWHLQPGH